MSERIYISEGYEGALAQCGYYTNQVQKVVSKWRGTIPEETIKDYFPPIGLAALWQHNEIQLRVVSPHQWPMIWELAAAVEQVRAENGIAYWLLKLPISVSTDRKWDSWKEIHTQIQRLVGPGHAFSVDAVKQTASRLRLVTSNPETIADYKASRP